MQRILITGGMGYIGSFTCKEYHKKFKSKPISIDNLHRSNIDAKFYCKNFKINISNKNKIKKIILENDIKKIIHLAGYTCVRESIKKPKLYHYNNYLNQIDFIKIAKKAGINYFIFSSTSSVYENYKIKKNLSNYSKYKFKIENYLKKNASKNFKVIIVRYPNVTGADRLGRLGDRNHKVTRIFKIFFKKIIQKKPVTIFLNKLNNQFPIRNYIHVEDIASINVKLIKNDNLFKKKYFQIFVLKSKLELDNYQILNSMFRLMKKKTKVLFKQIHNKESLNSLINGTHKNKLINISKKKTSLEYILKTNLNWFNKIKKEILNSRT